MREGIHPEVLELLTDILGDDEAALNRIARMRPGKAFPERVSVGSPFLTSRERHLLAWHREEVAFVLHQGTRLALQEGPAIDSKTTFEGTPVDRQDWERERARALLLVGSDHPAERRALNSKRAKGSYRSEWARLALALTPRDEVRVDLACALSAEERWPDAEAVAREVLDGSPSSYSRSAAASSLANSAYQQARPDEALRIYRRAALEREPAPAGPLFWLAHAVRTGDMAMIREAAERLQALREYGEETVCSYNEILRDEVRSGRWRPVKVSLPEDVEKHLSDPVREMIDAITSHE